eukprot:jgi/Undpi1/12097/HiC_scaffold_41.g14070.m1
MALPQQPDKYDEPAILEPAAMLAHRRRRGQGPAGEAPAALLMVFQATLLKHLVKKYRGQRIKGFFGDAYRLRRLGNNVMVIGNFGVGAPAAATVLEDAIAYGVREVVAIGIAGGLLSELQPGQLILVDKAARDEGTSHHYLPPQPFAIPDPHLHTSLSRHLHQQAVPFQVAGTWTTDAPYRETTLEAKHFAAQGCATVDMEQAALFTVGLYRQIPVAGLLVVADSLHEGGWRLDFPWPLVSAQLEQAADAIMGLWHE